MTLIVVTRESHLISHHIMMTTRPMMKRIKIAPALTVEPSPTSNINIPRSATMQMLTKPSPNIAPSCRWMVIFLSSFLSIEARGKYFVKCRSEMDKKDSVSFRLWGRKLNCQGWQDFIGILYTLKWGRILIVKHDRIGKKQRSST